MFVVGALFHLQSTIFRAVTFHPFATPTTFLILPLQPSTAPTTFLAVRRRTHVSATTFLVIRRRTHAPPMTFLAVRRRTHAPATTFFVIWQCRRTVCTILLYVRSLVFTRRMSCLIRVGVQPCGRYCYSECQYDLFHFNLLWGVVDGHSITEVVYSFVNVMSRVRNIIVTPIFP